MAKKVTMKSLKQSVKDALAKKNAAKAVAEFKPDMKHVRSLAHRITDHIKHHHSGLRDHLLALKGERPETLEAVLKETKDVLGKWLKSEGRNINAQSVYNQQSDITAAIRAFQKYAGGTDAERARFDKAMKGASSYHPFIKECRRYTKGGKGGTTNNKRKGLTPEESRVNGMWKNHKADAMAKAKDFIRFAPTAQLAALIDFAEAIFKARKEGNVAKLRAAKDGLAKVEELQAKKVASA